VARFVVDCETLLGMAAGEIEVDGEHKLVAPTLVRSKPPPRGDQLGWETTFDAEFVALAQLQADALVTSDSELAQAASASSRRPGSTRRRAARAARRHRPPRVRH
jgi:hypothetical protein